MFVPPPNTYCNKEIKANSDIGGPGVMASFLIMSWLTVFLAFFPALHEAQNVVYQWQSRGNPTQWQSLNGQIGAAATRPASDRFQMKVLFQTSEQHITNTEPGIVQKIEALFGPLCDLQAVSGVAIMIAGFAQWHTITFYHEQLVMYYWWLTLNSFWVARIHYMNLDSTGEPWLLRVRRFSVLFSCILAIIWQIRIFYRESNHWNDIDGPCYRFLDGTSVWPWVGGLILFSVALSSSLFEKTRFINNRYIYYTEKARDRLLTWLENSRQRCKGERQRYEGAMQRYKGPGNTQVVLPPVPKRQGVFHKAWIHVEVAIAALSVAIYWFLLQWLATWSCGDGFIPFTWFIYVGLNVWYTLDVVSLWAWNKPLISAEEQGWGFGQVLPLVLILSIGINALDIFRGGRLEHLTRTAEVDETGN